MPDIATLVAQGALIMADITLLTLGSSEAPTPQILVTTQPICGDVFPQAVNSGIILP